MQAGCRVGQIKPTGEGRAGQGWGGIRRTICDWKPSVLFLDLEFVAESLRLCILSVPVHVLVVVRRLRRFHTVLLWRGRRHVLFGGLQGRFLRRGCVCAGGLRGDLLASTSPADKAQLCDEKRPGARCG